MGKRVSAQRIKPVFSPKTRAYMYGVFLAMAPVAMFYGLVSGEEIGVWLTAIGAILGLSSGVALSNTPGVSKAKDFGDAG